VEFADSYFNFLTEKLASTVDMASGDIKNPRQSAAGEKGRKRLHPASLHEKERLVCEAAHTRPAGPRVFK
jgi:hypothetical protein